MDYVVLKSVHIAAVVVSGAGFFARGVGRILAARWVTSRLARTVPHVVDTVLLISAGALASHWPVLSSPWLLAKIAGLLVYIGLGMVAFRIGRTPAVRTTAWLAALLVFAYIGSVAFSKDPRGLFG